TAVVGSAINVTTAFVAFTAFLFATGRREIMVTRGWSLAHFVAAGLSENVGVFMNVVALSMGTVSVVTPLYGTAPIFVLFLAPLGVDEAGHHHVRADAERPEFRREGADQAEQPGLRDDHRRGVRPPGKARHPAERDDAPPPARLHRRDDGARQIERGVEVDAEHPMP